MPNTLVQSPVKRSDRHFRLDGAEQSRQGHAAEAQPVWTEQLWA
jgi:hypothetical protein